MTWIRLAGVIVVAATSAGCTHSGEIYDSKKHNKADYSSKNTAGLVVGTAAAAALLVAAAAGGGGGGYYAPATDYAFAWDYQPMNGQWVCRGRQTGQYHYPYRCSGLPVNDWTWPG